MTTTAEQVAHASGAMHEQSNATLPKNISVAFAEWELPEWNLSLKIPVDCVFEFDCTVHANTREEAEAKLIENIYDHIDGTEIVQQIMDNDVFADAEVIEEVHEEISYEDVPWYDFPAEKLAPGTTAKTRVLSPQQSEEYQLSEEHDADIAASISAPGTLTMLRVQPAGSTLFIRYTS
jgi:hypothetical protein